MSVVETVSDDAANCWPSSETVELLGGCGEELWPWPGRVLVVGLAHTFMDLADAINDAFGRWDRSHLLMLTLANAQLGTDGQMGAERAGSVGGPLVVPLDILSAKVVSVVAPGEKFRCHVRPG